MTCAEVDQDTYNRVQNDDELIFVCESCNQEELSSTASQVQCFCCMPLITRSTVQPSSH